MSFGVFKIIFYYLYVWNVGVGMFCVENNHSSTNIFRCDVGK